MNHTGTNPPNSPKTNVVAIIPARYESVRLPGKALQEIAGKPMICWVVERALAARNISRAIVATDDERILAAVKSAGYEAVITRADHRSGTDRIAQVAASLDDAEIVVNVQGDEPLISPLTIERAVVAIGEEEHGGGEEGSRGRGEEGNRVKGERGKGNRSKGHRKIGIVTTWEPMESAGDVDAVRRHGSLDVALSAEPSLLASFRKHTGLYVYRRDVLLEFAQWPQSELERLESLEQLRALEHGVKIKLIKADTQSIGVDTVEDLERVRSIVEEREFRISV